MCVCVCASAHVCVCSKASPKLFLSDLQLCPQFHHGRLNSGFGALGRVYMYVCAQVLMCMCMSEMEPHGSYFLVISSCAFSSTAAESLVAFVLCAMCVCVHVCVCVCACVYVRAYMFVKPRLSSFLVISSCALSSTTADSSVAFTLWAACTCARASAYVCVCLWSLT